MFDYLLLGCFQFSNVAFPDKDHPGILAENMHDPNYFSLLSSFLFNEYRVVLPDWVVHPAVYIEPEPAGHGSNSRESM